jgi:PAS domain S-box-containing protein
VQTYQSMVAVLNNLLRVPAQEVEATIEASLDQLCGLFNLRRAVIYLSDPSGGLHKAHRSRVDAKARNVELPLQLPADLVASWFQEGYARHSVVVSGEAFLVGLSNAKERESESFFLFPMLDAAALKGALAVAPQEASRLNEVHLEMLGFAADILRNVLSLRGAEMQLNEERRRHAQLMASLPDQVFELDASGCFTGLLAGPKHLLQAYPNEITGKHLRAAVPVEIAGILQSALEETLASGNLATRRYQLRTGEALKFFELATSLAHGDATAGGPQVHVMVRDVTRQADLHNDLMRLGKIVEAMNNLVVILDRDHKIVWVNAAFERHTGWSLAEIKGEILGPLVRNEASDPVVVAALNEALRKEQPFRGEIINTDRAGNAYWVDFNALPLFDPQGSLMGYVSVETDITALKEQEAATARHAAAAEAAHTRLNNAIQALTDAVVIFDAEDRLVAVNESYRNSLPALASLAVPGAKLEDLLRKGAEARLFGKGESEEAKEAWVHKRLQEYRLPRMDEEVQSPDGSWVRRINTRTADGGSILVAIDITESRTHIAEMDAANRELRRALAERDNVEQRLAGLIAGTEVGTWEHDLATNILSFGGYASATLGYEPSMLRDMSLGHFFKLVHPDDHRNLPTMDMFEAESDTAITESEFRMRHALGHWVWILSRARVTQRDAQGRATVISGVNLDISERKHLEQELAARRAFLLQVINASVSALVVLDDAGAVSFVNLEASKLLGTARSIEMGQSFSDVAQMLETLEGAAIAEQDMPHRIVLQNSEPLRDYRLALRLPGGERRILMCNAAPLTIAADRLGVVMAFADITDDLAATARLEEALTRAEDVSKAKSIFLANMSHEIRTPLNGVLGMAEVLADLVVEPVQKRMVSTIRKSGETLLTVLNGILDMSKIEAGKMALEIMPFQPAELMRQMEAIFSVVAEEKGIEFEVFSSAGAEKPRLGDPHRLMQILNNLLNNAMKFTEKGRVSLKISCRSGKPFAIEVSDSGVGMKPEQLSRVFESFEQADGSMTRRFGGTGLGLSIVRQLVTLMGGEITVESELGQGTTFRVSLPLPESEVQISSAGAKEIDFSEAEDLQGVRVLSADDNLTNRIVLGEMLARFGVELLQVENGKDAVTAWEVAQAQGAPYDLLCLDITMPVMDGMTALGQIRSAEISKNLPSVPAIAITANAMPHQVADYIVGGFDTHLSKPFKQRDLLHALRSILQV